MNTFRCSQSTKLEHGNITTPTTMAKYLGHIFLLVGASLQQKDPLKDFCRRFGSQSAVVDERLYLDGGLTNWNPIAQNPRNSSSLFLCSLAARLS